MENYCGEIKLQAFSQKKFQIFVFIKFSHQNIFSPFKKISASVFKNIFRSFFSRANEKEKIPDLSQQPQKNRSMRR
jgi:hypothetical protein